ncbi:MAG: Dot/Icm secretion system protein IcmQ [Gammaproteobacteria bacterium]|nr:Dot/Icm secretion system protein IcmQ [Gammaproteobacteria bacterium]
MASREHYKEITDKLIELLQDLLASGNWEASLFLRTAHKKYQDLLDQALALSQQIESNHIKYKDEEYQLKIKQGFISVYVSIYQSDPFNMMKWETTLKSIKEYSINRPIYRTQEHIEEMLRSKNSPNEGYVSILIQPSDIIRPYTGKIIEDRWGHELLTLRENSLVSHNILEFVHHGRRFLFKKGKLLLKSDSR